MKHYADRNTGKYLGGWDVDIPANSIEVLAPPTAYHIWVKGAWEAPAVAVPEEITMRQARLALLGASLLEAAEGLIRTMDGAAGEVARIEWSYAQSVRRDWELVDYLGKELGLSQVEVDNLFIQAAGL